jgi:hypothetical protein
MKLLIKAAIAFLFTLVAACIASAQTTANINSKCDNCPPQYHANSVSSSVSYNGNADTNHAYPSHVQIVNKGTMSVDGTRFVKYAKFGFVFNYPSRSMQLYWLKDTKRLDFATTKPVLAPILQGAKRFYEEFTIIGVGTGRFYYDIETANVVGYTLEHWDFPDASGQRVTREGEVNEY